MRSTTVARSQSASNLLDVNLQFDQRSCKCVAMHPQLPCGSATMKGAHDQYSDDVAPSEFTNGVFIGQSEGAHLENDAAQGLVHRGYASGCSIAGRSERIGRGCHALLGVAIALLVFPEDLEK